MQLHLHEDKVPATHAPEFGYLDYVSKLIPPHPTSKLLQLVPTQMLKLKAFGRPSLVRDVPAYWKDEEGSFGDFYSSEMFTYTNFSSAIGIAIGWKYEYAA